MNGIQIPLKSRPSGSSDSRHNVAAVSVSPISPGSLASRFRDTLGPDLVRQAKVLHPVSTDEFRLLLLENISQGAMKAFKDQGFQVDHFTRAWSEDELVEKIGSYHAIGIRSKTKITERVIKAASKVCLYPLDVLQSPKHHIALGHRLFLYRHQPSRSPDCSKSRHPCLQFAFFQLSLGRRTRYRRDHWPFTTAIRPFAGNEGRHME
jgi:hypothetical protein